MARSTFNNAARSAMDIILERYFTTGDPRMLQVLGASSAKKPDAEKTEMDRAVEVFSKTGDESSMLKLAMARAWETQNTSLTISLLKPCLEQREPPAYSQLIRATNIDDARRLLEAGMDQGAPPKYSQLMHTTNIDDARRLLEAGADPNRKDTALDYAWRHNVGKDEFLLMLLHGAKSDPESKQASPAPQARPLVFKI